MTGDPPSEQAGGKCAAGEAIGDSELSERPDDLANPKGPNHTRHLLDAGIGHTLR